MAPKGIVVAFVSLACLARGPICMAADQSAALEAHRAQEALEAAEQAVRHAREQRALWTTAQEALEQARAAAAQGDYPGAIRAARLAAEQAHLGVAQSSYPRLNE